MKIKSSKFTNTDIRRWRWWFYHELQHIFFVLNEFDYRMCCIGFFSVKMRIRNRAKRVLILSHSKTASSLILACISSNMKIKTCNIKIHHSFDVMQYFLSKKRDKHERENCEEFQCVMYGFNLCIVGHIQLLVDIN